jgi:protein-disulfide isomerase
MNRSRSAFLVIALSACQSPSSTQGRPPALGPAGAAADRAAVVAKIDGETVTSGELDDSVRGGIIRADVEHAEKLYELRSDGLDKLLNDRLIAKKAKAAGVTAEALVKKEVYDKVQLPTEAEEKALYDQAVASGKELPPYEQIKDEIAQFIRTRKNEGALKEYTDGLKKEAKVERLLPPLLLPKVAVEPIGPARGEQAAPITIVEFSDYECPFCGRAEPTVKDVLEKYKGKVRLVYREFPLAMHPHAQKASEAALCAHEQGKFWEMHAKLFDNQRNLEVGDLKGYAKALALDSGKFDECLDSGAKAKEIALSQKAGEEAGVNGTPAFFINGRPLFGAVPLDRFKDVIDAELASAGDKKQ